MMLRRKTLLTIGLALGGLILLLYAVTRAIVLESFARLEQEKASANLQRVLNLVADQYTALGAQVADWATWDDSYAFIQSVDAEYIDLNLTASTYANLNVNVMLFVDLSGAIVFGRAFDLATLEEAQIPPDLQRFLLPGEGLIDPRNPERGAAGIVTLAEGPMLIASRPILTSEGQGPVYGSLVWGRFLDDAEIGRLEQLTHLSITLYNPLDGRLPTDVEDASRMLSALAPALVQPIDGQTIAGYGLLPDITGNAAAILKVRMPRDIYQHGQAAVSLILGSLILIGVASIGMTTLLVEKTVLSRLARLSASVQKFVSADDLAFRVPVSGHDELSALAVSINDMLERLAASQSQLRQINADLEARIADRTDMFRRSKEHAEAILNNSSDAIVLARADGVVKQTNPAFNALFGYEIDEMFGQSLLTLVTAEDVGHVQEALRLTAEDNEPRRLEVTACHRDGSTFAADIAIAPIKEPGQRQLVVVCSLRDITERKLMEQELRKALQREKELSELKSRFTSMVSHEFRTPLTTILSSSHLLRSHGHKMDEDKRLEHFSKIEIQVRRLSEMLEDIITLGKAETARLELKPEVVDLRAFCRNLIDELQQTQGMSHEIVFSAAGECIEAEVDERLMRQALTNLLTNAMKYSPGNSMIRLELGREGEMAVIRVADKGIGIPEEDQKHLFEPFHRAKNVGSIAGSGLGLAIVKQAVEAHGGSITFQSAVGVGTTFTVSMPLSNHQAELA